jgi:hypothetical protein
MQARYRKIKSGEKQDYLFPVAKLTDTTVKRGATISDTVSFIPKVVRQTKWQTKKIAKLLKGDSVYTTCRNIWEFVYNHIRYHKDDEGREQIRSPARAWHDKERGVDCDCYTVFISSILVNLGIPHLLRITKYSQDHFQHIYPVVPTGAGSHITIDCVVDRFNQEEPYTEKQDTPMDLQYLEGLEENDLSSTNRTNDMSLDEEEGELGKRGWFKRFSHNFLHSLNRYNPVTIALRNGILASMKLNLFKVPQRLKYAYLTEEEAKKRKVDMAKWEKLVTIKDKLANIYYGAGGKKENLKKAMLKGKGNHNHEVSGLGFVPDDVLYGMDENTPLRELLGDELWNSENDNEKLGELGDPATGASVAAASGVMGIIAELLKGVGNLFGGKKDDPASDDFQTTPQDDAAATDAAGDASATDKSLVDNAPDTPGGDDESKDADGNPVKKGFWNKNKKWLTPTLVGIGVVGVATAGYKAMSGDKPKKKPEKKEETGKKEKAEKKPTEKLEGLKSKKRRTKKKELGLL